VELLPRHLPVRNRNLVRYRFAPFRIVLFSPGRI
jgi:hypothetical protein